MGSECGAGKVLIVGSVAMDNVKTPAGEAHDALGGAAVYSSVASSYFAPVRIVGVVGDDFPDRHVGFLTERGIDLAGLQRVSGGKTFKWSGFYDTDLNQAHTIETQLNVFQDFRPHIPQEYRESEYVFLANIDPDLQLQVLDQIESPKLTVCDTMNYWIESKRDSLVKVLGRVDVAFLNDAEARQLSGSWSLIKAARDIRAMGPSVVIIKKGENGAVMFSEDSYFSAPSYPLEMVKDPTGAGDSFAGGFIGYIASCGRTDEGALRQAIIYGSTVASFNVEDFSLGKLSSLSMDEILGRYGEIQAIAHFDPAA